MANSADQDIICTLSSFQEQLFPTLRGGDSALADFLARWTSFNDTIQCCAEGLQAGTLEMLLNFSNLVASVTGGLARALSLSEKLLDEVSTVVGESATPDEPKEQVVVQQAGPYIKLASEWLVANVHNPYPSQSVRASFATETNSLKKDVDGWFLDARKRIGWNDLRRNHFDNKQSKIVDAAKRFFLNTDPSRPLPPLVESAFAKIQLQAQELYSNKFEESPLAARLDVFVNSKVNLKVRDTRGGLKPRVSPSAKATRHYPSPQPSPSRQSHSASPSPASSIPKLSSPSSKRRASALPELEEGTPSKRLRVSTAQSNGSASPELRRHTSPVLLGASLPSPVTSSFDETEVQPPPHSPPHNLKRKRNPSDAESSPVPKRSRTTPSPAEPSSVSDPLLTSYAAAEFDWDQLDFSTLPPPVSVLSTDDIAGPVNVSVFEFPPDWDQYGCDALGLLGDPSVSLDPLDVGVTNSFSTQALDSLDDGLSIFNSSSHGGPSGLLEELLSTKECGLYSLPNISSDFVPLANQAIDPLVLPTDTHCLPNFSVPIFMTPQAILAQAQAAPEPTVTTPKSELQAKQEQLRLLQAQVAALTAEIASAS